MLSLEKLTISTIARAILLQDSEIVSLVMRMRSRG